MSLSVPRHSWTKYSWKALFISLLVGLTLVIGLSAARGFDNLQAGLDASPRNAQGNYSSPRRSKTTLPSFCNAYDVSQVAISIKTGATESRNKVSTQLMTFLRCVPDVMLFSDLDQRIGSLDMDDVLKMYTEDSTRGLLDFDIYRQQQKLAEQGRDIELQKLSKLPIPYDDWRSAGKSAAWGLDKYKFLSMIQRAWERQPMKDWYVFIEVDTYLSISNLLRFLATQNPKQQLYFGNAVRMWEHPTPLEFAHGGYVVCKPET